MVQIYQEQVKEDRSPLTPDVSEMQYFAKKREAGIEKVGDIADETMKVVNERIKKEQDGQKTITKLAALQVYKNAKELHPNEPDRYRAFVDKGLADVYSAVPDSQAKREIMAEVYIHGTGYDASVQKGYQDKQENIYKARFVDNTASMVDAAVSNSGIGFTSEAQDLTPDEKLKRRQAYDDARMTMQAAYNNINVTDRNGNPLLSVSERAAIEDKWKNFGYYASVDFAGDNIEPNRAGVVAMYNEMVNNPVEYKAKYGISDETYQKSVVSVGKIISGQTTAAEQKSLQARQVETKAILADMEIRYDGKKVKVSGKYNNLNDTIKMFTRLDNEISEKVYEGPDEKDAMQKQAALGLLITQQVEDKVGVQGERWGIMKKLNWGKANAGEVALAQVNENFNDMQSAFDIEGISEGERINIKARMYRDTIGTLAASQIDLTDKSDPKNKDRAKQVANRVMIDFVEGYTGEKLPIKPEDSNNPTAIRSAIKTALLSHKHDLAQNYIDGLYK